MTTKYNVEEILEIACQVERNGAAFYRAAADVVSMADARSLLLELARMEDGHESTFKQMHEESPELDDDLADPEGLAATYLRAVASSHVFVSGVRPADRFKSDSTAEDILRIALQAEFASIAFFQGLLEFMPATFGPEKLKEIIREEQEHVVILSAKLRALPNIQK